MRNEAHTTTPYFTVISFRICPANSGSVRGSPNGTIGNFANGTIGSQWHHWLTNGTNSNIGRANGSIGITIGTNDITNGTIGITLNDISISLVPLVEP